MQQKLRTQFWKTGKSHFHTYPLHCRCLLKTYTKLSMKNWILQCVWILTTKMSDARAQKSIFQDCSFTSSMFLRERKWITGIQGDRQLDICALSDSSTKQAIWQWKHPNSPTAKKLKSVSNCWKSYATCNLECRSYPHWIHALGHNNHQECLIWHAVITVHVGKCCFAERNLDMWCEV